MGINVPKDHDIRHELEVNGRILAEEIEVVAHVADYVFDDDFLLMELDEVESFIAEHRHLPGIPSESDITQRGGTVSLGEAFTGMLQYPEQREFFRWDRSCKST